MSGGQHGDELEELKVRTGISRSGKSRAMMLHTFMNPTYLH